MKLFLRKFARSCVAMITLLLCTGCSRRVTTVQSVDTAMGTIISQTIYTEEQDSSVETEILQEITALEEEVLSWRLAGTEVAEINSAAGQSEGTQVSEKMQQILEKCNGLSQDTDGAFDITIGPVTRLWNMDEQATLDTAFVIPDQADIEAALENTGYEKISMSEDRVFLTGDLQIDLGAVGKGIAMDQVLAVLEGHEEVCGAVISVGGSILTYGTKPEGGDWKVAIVNPRDTSANLGVLSLNGQWCVSTSGDYERYFEVDGKRYHHIMDPNTGYPADSGVSSVTILCRDGFYSDALSTACFVLGTEEGMKLAEKYGAEALFVENNGEITMTAGMKTYFSLAK